MHIFPITPESMVEAVRIIQRGGVVVHPTETCYGLACDLTNVEAVERLFVLKKRPTREAVSALFPSIEEAKKYVLWNTLAEKLAKKYLPGPLTMVLKLREIPEGDLPSIVCLPDQETLGIRLSSHPIAQELANKAGIPLSTTSANVHGKPSLYSAQEVRDQFSTESLQPDLILDGGLLPAALPSTVVAVRGNSLEVLRKGGIELLS